MFCLSSIVLSLSHLSLATFLYLGGNYVSRCRVSLEDAPSVNLISLVRYCMGDTAKSEFPDSHLTVLSWSLFGSSSLLTFLVLYRGAGWFLMRREMNRIKYEMVAEEIETVIKRKRQPKRQKKNW